MEPAVLAELLQLLKVHACVDLSSCGGLTVAGEDMYKEILNHC